MIAPGMTGGAPGMLTAVVTVVLVLTALDLSQFLVEGRQLEYRRSRGERSFAHRVIKQANDAMATTLKALAIDAESKTAVEDEAAGDESKAAAASTFGAPVPKKAAHRGGRGLVELLQQASPGAALLAQSYLVPGDVSGSARPKGQRPTKEGDDEEDKTALDVSTALLADAVHQVMTGRVKKTQTPIVTGSKGSRRSTEGPQQLGRDSSVSKAESVASRGFTTQNSAVNADGSKLYRNIAPKYCIDGAVAVPNTTIFTCGASNANYTAAVFTGLLPVDQADCSIPSDTELTCVCSDDFVLGAPLFALERCFPKNIRCNTKIVAPNISCPVQDVNQAEQDAVCFETTRRSSVTVSSNISCAFKYVSPEEYENFAVTLLSTDAIRDISFVTLPRLKVSEAAVRTDVISSQLAPYRTLELTAFEYADASTSPDIAFRLTKAHPLFTNGTMFSQIYNFRHLSDQTHLSKVRTNTTFTTGQLSGRNTTSFTFNLADVGAAFVSGGRMYLEIGFYGPYLDDSVTADHMFIDFSDLPMPSASVELSNTLTVVLIVIGCILGLCLLGAIAIWFRNYKAKQQKGYDEEEDE